MKQKSCMKCGEVKSLAAFYRHPGMADGTVNKCKECNKKEVRENREKKIDYYREYDRSRSMNPDRADARSAYQQTPEGVIACSKAKEKWRESNTIKRAAQILLRNAVLCGRLQKPKYCEQCGKSGRIHGHHPDYALPLSVMWLCPKCHTAWHRAHGEGING